jgi:hypothetical protein
MYNYTVIVKKVIYQQATTVIKAENDTHMRMLAGVMAGTLHYGKAYSYEYEIDYASKKRIMPVSKQKKGKRIQQTVRKNIDNILINDDILISEEE